MPYIYSFLKQCRPLSVSMAHAIKTLKREISQIERGTEDNVVSIPIKKNIFTSYYFHIERSEINNSFCLCMMQLCNTFLWKWSRVVASTSEFIESCFINLHVADS